MACDVVVEVVTAHSDGNSSAELASPYESQVESYDAAGCSYKASFVSVSAEYGSPAYSAVDDGVAAVAVGNAVVDADVGRSRWPCLPGYNGPPDEW